jgi:hypothetical protein
MNVTWIGFGRESRNFPRESEENQRKPRDNRCPVEIRIERLPNMCQGCQRYAKSLSYIIHVIKQTTNVLCIKPVIPMQGHQKDIITQLDFHNVDYDCSYRIPCNMNTDVLLEL